MTHFNFKDEQGRLNDRFQLNRMMIPSLPLPSGGGIHTARVSQIIREGQQATLLEILDAALEIVEGTNRPNNKDGRRNLRQQHQDEKNGPDHHRRQ
jgi:hypothetical protein